MSLFKGARFRYGLAALTRVAAYLGSAFYAIVVFAARQAGTHRALLGLVAAGFARTPPRSP